MVPVRQNVAKPIAVFAISPAYLIIETVVTFVIVMIGMALLKPPLNVLCGIFFAIPFHLWAIYRTQAEPDATIVIVERIRTLAGRVFGIRAKGYPFPAPTSPFTSGPGSYVP